MLSVVEEILPMVLFCFASAITPGPNTIMLMTSSLNHGIQKSIPHFIGIVIGFNLMLVSVAFGFGALILHLPMVHPIIKVVGSAYLLFLAWKIAATVTVKDQKPRSPFTLLQAVLFQWLNPKAWIVTVGAVASFTNAGNFSLMFSRLLLTSFIVGSFSMLVWLYFGAMLNRLIHKPVFLRRFNIVMGLLLALSVLPMLDITIFH